jgi:hypothetical protein
MLKLRNQITPALFTAPRTVDRRSRLAVEPQAETASASGAVASQSWRRS